MDIVKLSWKFEEFRDSNNLLLAHTWDAEGVNCTYSITEMKDERFPNMLGKVYYAFGIGNDNIAMSMDTAKLLCEADNVYRVSRIMKTWLK